MSTSVRTIESWFPGWLGKTPSQRKAARLKRPFPAVWDENLRLKPKRRKPAR